MGFLHRCSCRKKWDGRGQEPVPAETQWTYSCLSYSLLFPLSSQTSISLSFFLSFFHPLALFRSPSLLLSTKALRQQDSRALASVFLRLWENSSSCFLRCFSHSSPRFQITRAQWVGRTRSANTAERSDKVWSFSSRERANTKLFFCAHVCFLCSTGLSKWYLGHQIIAYPCSDIFLHKVS